LTSRKLPPSSRRPEVELLDVVVLAQELGVLVHHDLAGLHHVAVGGDRQRHVGVLLDEQDRGALLVDLDDHVPDLLHDQRREAERGLVEQQVARLGHQRAPEGEHLLLAAGEVAGELLAALGEAREEGVDAVEVVPQVAAVGGVAPDAQVLVHVELPEDPPALHDLGDPGTHRLRRVEPVDRFAVEGDGALGDLATVDVEQPRDGPQHRGLPGAVGAEQRHDGVVGHLDADALEHEDDVLVDDLEVLDGEHAHSHSLDHARTPRRHRLRCWRTLPSWFPRTALPERDGYPALTTMST
jgi:hypothetical protein